MNIINFWKDNALFNLFGSIPRTLVRRLAIASSLKSGVNTSRLAAGCFILQ
jgi:hypothetical protein